EAVAGLAGERLFLLGMALEERGVEELGHRDVEPVEPDHGAIGRVAVVVPGARRRDDEIALLHRRALAVDAGIGARTVDHEAQRRLAVSMGGRDLARHHELEAGVEAGGDPALPSQARVLEDQYPSLGLARADQRTRLDQVGPELVVAPQPWLAGARRRRRDQRAEHGPQRGHREAVDAAVEILAGGLVVRPAGSGRGVHGVLPWHWGGSAGAAGGVALEAV